MFLSTEKLRVKVIIKSSVIQQLKYINFSKNQLSMELLSFFNPSFSGTTRC